MLVSPLPLSLFGAGQPSVVDRPRFERHELDPCCWIDRVERFIEGGDELFARVESRFEWFRGKRLMYGKWYDEPRLTAKLELDDERLPTVVLDAVNLLSGHYGRAFDGLFCNYYQDGADSVAWHADRIGRTNVDPLVAIISLGGPRTFVVRDRSRATSGEPAARFTLHSGDLLVMGGATQHHWEHSVPKSAGAPPRISLTTRAG